MDFVISINPFILTVSIAKQVVVQYVQNHQTLFSVRATISVWIDNNWASKQCVPIFIVIWFSFYLLRQLLDKTRQMCTEIGKIHVVEFKWNFECGEDVAVKWCQGFMVAKKNSLQMDWIRGREYQRRIWLYGKCCGFDDNIAQVTQQQITKFATWKKH